MSFIDQFQLLSQYNRWMNQKIYSACNELSDADRKHNSGAFFGSIHNTLDHIVYGDLAWIERLRDDQFTPKSIGSVVFDSWEMLSEKRVSLDHEIDRWVNTFDASQMEAIFSYTSNVDKLTRSGPYWSLVLHMFNHQTHHRGQVTTLLNQLGIDIGATDIPAMPSFITE